MLRSTITTDVQPPGVQFSSQGTPFLPSANIAIAEDEGVVRQREALEAKVRVAMDLGRKHAGTDLAQAAEIARQFNVPTSQVLPHLPQWRYASESAKDDPAEFIAKNRELVDALADKPDVMAAVVVDPNVSPLVRLLQKAKDTGVMKAIDGAGT